MATLGNATSTGKSDWPPTYAEVAGPYLAPGNGTITDFTIKAQGNASGDAPLSGVVYVDSAGEPDAKVATSSEITILSAQAAGEVTAACPGSIVGGSYYWLGFELAGSGFSTVGIYAAVGTSRYKTSGTYPTAPDPFGAASAFTDGIHAYITYTPSAGPANTGGFFGLMLMRPWDAIDGFRRRPSGLLIPERGLAAAA